MNDYINEYGIFKSIAATSVKIEKQEIIAANGKNKLFTAMLNLLYNDFIRTGLAIKKVRKVVKVEPNVQINNIKDAMVYVATHKTGSDQDIANIQFFINQAESDEHREFLEELFTKTYKCGITVSTVNKAMGKNFIPEFGCQLAHPYEKYADKIKGDFVLTQKLDGHRVLAFVEPGGSIVFTTRKGHEIEGLVQIENAIRESLDTTMVENGCVLDGEVVLTNADSKFKQDELFRETSKVLKKAGTKKDLTFHVFDMVDYNEFKEGQSKATYFERRGGLEASLVVVDEFLTIVETLYIGSDKDKIEEYSLKATENGWEGIMLNLAEGLYKTKRTPALLKVKKFFNSDVQVMSVYPGHEGGELEDTLGGVTIDFKGYKVDVGSGFTHEEREYFWSNQDEIVGKIINVQYFEESHTENKGVKKVSLRFPTFKGLRLDKSIEDISYES